MTIRREWLNWDAPALPAAANWLVDRACELHANKSGHWCDLQATVCVLPGRRAGRILLGQLLLACEKRSVQLVPPVVLTPGALTDFVLTPGGAFANQVEIELAWLAALQQANINDLEALLPQPPARDDIPGWLAMAKVIANLHAELAGQRIGFDAVALQAERLERLNEGARWHALHAVCQHFQAQLDAAGLVDPHAAREHAIARLLNDQSIEPAPAFTEFVLIGVADLNQLQRTVVNIIRQRAVALVHAPENLAEHFDSLGCVDAERWTQQRIELDSDQITIADRPDDQAQHALAMIGALNAAYSASEITIGLGDPDLAAALQHAGEWAGLSLRYAEQHQLSQSAPLRALEAIADWLEDPRLARFAELLRHPDIERYVEAQSPRAARGTRNWLALLDEYFSEFLHEHFTGNWLGDEKIRAPLAEVHGAICRLVQPLATQKRAHIGGVGGWAQPVVDVLNALYSHSSQRPWQGRNEACTRICEALSEFAAAPAKLQPNVTAAQAIRLGLDCIAREPVPQEINSDQIEMLGWLELHLDPAPVLILTGVTEGNIPQSASADPFLPDSLRQKLGLACNASRFARDAYLLTAMNASRERLQLVVGRRSARGEPLTPSRLLLACDDQTLVQRIGQFCDERSDASPPPVRGLKPSNSKSRFQIPQPSQIVALLESLNGGRPWAGREYMNITEFRTYISCPYRYALERLLKLQSCDDSETEMDPMRFGTLAHQVLCAFGNDSALNRCDEPAKIERFLIETLQTRAAAQFGDSMLPAIRIQLARLEQRLRSFATLQAELVADGWRIRHCELQFEREIALDFPGAQARGGPMPLWGKIDRVDHNEKTGQWRIIDYKTSESAESPHQAHHKREKLVDPSESEWHDLQLPLYHFLASRSKHKIQGEVELAYICLPKQTDGAAVKVAEWRQAHLDHAIERAREIVCDIRAGRFEINPDYNSPFDAFARICQTTAFADVDSSEIETAEVEA